MPSMVNIEPAVQEKKSKNVKKKKGKKSLQRRRQQRQTTCTFRSEKLIWVFASGQLKHKIKVVKMYVLNAELLNIWKPKKCSCIKKVSGRSEKTLVQTPLH